jgi:hypothetical protein
VGVGNAHKTLNYCKFLIAKRLAIWRLNITAQAFKICDSNKEKATLLKLLICHFSRADYPHTSF